MSDPFDDDDRPGPAGANQRPVERVRARTSVTSPRITQPDVAAVFDNDDDADSIFGSTLSGKAAAAPAAPATPREPMRTDPAMVRPSLSGTGRAEGTDPFASRPSFSGPLPVSSRNRSGLTVVRASDVSASGPFVASPTPAAAPTLDPSLLPPRRAAPAPPPPLAGAVGPAGTPPPPMGMSAASTTPTPRASLDDILDPVVPSAAERARSLDPPMAPQGSRPRPRPATNPSLPTPRSVGDAPPMAPRAPLPTGLRDDGTALSPAEAALPSLFKEPAQVQRRRIKIAATGIASIALAAVTVVLWLGNRPPPPRTGSTNFSVADKHTISAQYRKTLTPIAQKDVQMVVTRIVATVARPLRPADAEPLTVTIIDGDAHTAFATADGHLVLSTGLLKSLESQAELAAVAAHLLAHQTRFHLDDALDAEAVTLVPEVRVAVTSADGTPGGKRAATVGEWHVGREAEEQEADREAITALKRASWDATALRGVWQRFATRHPTSPLVMRHPWSPARMEALAIVEGQRLQGSDLVQGDAGRTNTVEYESLVLQGLNPVVIAPPTPEPTAADAPASPATPVTARRTTQVKEPAVAARKAPPRPEPPAAPTPRSPRDAND